MLLSPAASQCHHQSGAPNSCTMSTSSITHPRSGHIVQPISLRSYGSLENAAYLLGNCLAGEDAVLAEGAVPSQEVTGRLDK